MFGHCTPSPSGFARTVPRDETETNRGTAMSAASGSRAEDSSHRTCASHPAPRHPMPREFRYLIFIRLQVEDQMHSALWDLIPSAQGICMESLGFARGHDEGDLKEAFNRILLAISLVFLHDTYYRYRPSSQD